MCADGGQRLAGIEIFKGVTGRHEFVEASQNVVSGDDANPQLVGQSMPGRDHPHSFGTGLGVDAPGVGNDAHVFARTCGRMRSIRATKSVANPAFGFRDFCFCMMDMVTSAR